MNLLESLRTLARGERPREGLLHTCRLEGLGGEAYGQEAIVEAMRRAPLAIADTVTVIQSGAHLALFTPDSAWFADLAPGGIARLWRLGSAQSLAAEPRIAVPFDPDLMQARGDVLFAPGDHPGLPAEAEAKVRTIAAQIAGESNDAYRARAFVIRAFGTAERGAALLAVYRLAGEERRSLGYVMAAAAWDGDAVITIVDEAGAKAMADARWTPRVLA